MLAPFTARRADRRAEWRVVYDLVADFDYGREITFAELAEALDTDDSDRARIHRAVKRCNEQFIRECKPRVLGNVRGQGYKVLEPAQYATAALAMRKRAAKTVGSAVDLMRTAPLDDMSPAQRDWAHKVTMVMMDHENRFRSQEQRQADAEQRIRDLEERVGMRPKVVDHEPEPAT